MRTDEIVQRLEPWLVKQRRPAWKPLIEDGEGAATASKFCGTPWTGPDAPWPDCGHYLLEDAGEEVIGKVKAWLGEPAA